MTIDSGPTYSRPVRPPLSLPWVVLSAAALSLATALGGQATVRLATLLEPTGLLSLINPDICVGAAIGVALALLGRGFAAQAARRPRYWTLATVVGATVGMSGANALLEYNAELPAESAVVAIGAGLTAGLATGALQCLVLWRTPAAWVRWTVAQGLGFACAFLIYHMRDRSIIDFWPFSIVWLGMWGAHSLIIWAAANHLSQLASRQRASPEVSAERLI